MGNFIVPYGEMKAVKVRNNTKQNMAVKTEQGNVQTGHYADEIS